MGEIRALVRQAVEAKNAVEEDWLDIQTSELYRKAMLMGRGEVMRKKGEKAPPVVSDPL
jgi:hypothetical protein